jgi:hypothetical protein
MLSAKEEVEVETKILDAGKLRPRGVRGRARRSARQPRGRHPGPGNVMIHDFENAGDREIRFLTVELLD